MGRVSQRIALVTGGGSGIGAAICAKLAAEGATVVVSDRSQPFAAHVADALPRDSAAIELDVASEPSWRAAIAHVEQRFGQLDILVNNAGVLSAGDAEDVDLEHFRWVNSIMSEGVFLGCKHAIPLMAKGVSGSIVNISSTAALSGYTGFVAYCAAKGAVRSMTKAVAASCQDKGYPIRCNSVHPGDIETPMTQAFEGRAAKAVPAGILPKGAIGAPSDIANMVLFLASDESRFITASEFVVDNGVTSRPAW